MPLEKKLDVGKEAPASKGSQNDVMRRQFGSKQQDTGKITAFSHLWSESWAPEQDQRPPEQTSSPLHSHSPEQLRTMKSTLKGLSPQEINANLGALDTSISEKLGQREHLPQNDRDGRIALSSEMRAATRKKVFFLDVLRMKDKEGLLPDEHRTTYDKARLSELTFKRTDELGKLGRKEDQSMSVSEEAKIHGKYDKQIEDLQKSITELESGGLSQGERTAIGSWLEQAENPSGQNAS